MQRSISINLVLERKSSPLPRAPEVYALKDKQQTGEIYLPNVLLGVLKVREASLFKTFTVDTVAGSVPNKNFYHTGSSVEENE